VAAAAIAIGRKPRARVAGLVIASTAIAEGLALFTTNPEDFSGCRSRLVRVGLIAVETEPRVVRSDPAVPTQHTGPLTMANAEVSGRFCVSASHGVRDR
jgi:hypothetical protein